MLIAHPEGEEALRRIILGRSTGMILGVSLGGFIRVLLRVQVVRVGQMGVMGGLLAVAGLAMFSCLSVVARSLFIVLCCCVVVLCT